MSVKAPGIEYINKAAMILLLSCRRIPFCLLKRFTDSCCYFFFCTLRFRLSLAIFQRTSFLVRILQPCSQGLLLYRLLGRARRDPGNEFEYLHHKLSAFIFTHILNILKNLPSAAFDVNNKLKKEKKTFTI